MSSDILYLDAMSTTPLDPRVFAAMRPYLDVASHFGNPGSQSHSLGWEAADAIERAREQVASAIGASPEAVIFTSGATEANNLAIKGAADFYSRKGQHFIATQDAHKAVLEPLSFLESRGSTVKLLPVEKTGQLDLQQLERSLQPETVLVSVLAVNNETGAIADIPAMAECVHRHGALLHVDAAQALGKVPVDVEAWDADLVSFSAHKAYGPKGVGALYVRQAPRRVRLTPLLQGGGQERNLRAGTLPTHQVVGMGEAFSIAAAEQEVDVEGINQLRDQLWSGLTSLPGARLNGALDVTVSHCLNISFLGIRADTLLAKLPGIAASAGSACNSVTPEPSHVIQAMGLGQERAISAVRLSLNRFTTQEEVTKAIELIREAVLHLHQLMPEE